MNILHFSLGLPPLRSGGLTKYATDLMLSQAESGENVYLLYPQSNLISRSKKGIFPLNKYNKVSVYKLTNSSNIPLLDGIRNPLNIIQNEKYPFKKGSLTKIFEDIKPDIFHIHTLMGLPLELLDFLKDKGVKIVFTSHDYYGLCPRANFINLKGNFCDTPSGINCSTCNFNSPHSLVLKVRNSKLILKHKALLSPIFNRLNRYKSIKIKNDNPIYPSQERINEYNNLLAFFKNELGYVDIFHFNSSISAEVFKTHIDIKKSAILPISHRNISDHRKIKNINKECIHIGFIGNISEYKGFPLLINVLKALKNRNINNWRLHVWGNNYININDDQIICEGKYNSSELNKVYNQLDLLVVPSIWKETFSLITLEAISYGVPVIVSSNVGAKDIIKEYNPNFIFPPSEKELCSLLERILSDTFILSDYNSSICSNKFRHSFSEHVSKVKEIYNN